MVLSKKEAYAVFNNKMIRDQMIQNASRLYDELIKFGGQYCQWSDVRHLGVMAWMMVGLIATGSVNLTKWISHINTKAESAQSTQRQLSRWLNNPRINPACVIQSSNQSRISKLARCSQCI